MVYNFPYLKDFAFLKQFDQIKLKQQFVKLVVLTFNEQPIEEIQGKVISGSFNLDGTSSMRRTGNINLVANEYQNDLTKTKNLLSINKKIQVLVGFTNTTKQYTQYDILWFPLGIYVIIAANISNSLNGINIALTLHDKMALLNGECGGVLPASIVLNQIEDIDENGQTVITQPTIYQIIQELVNHFGGEQLGKIIIADLDDQAKQIMKWTGSNPLYCWQTTSGGNISYNFSTNPSYQAGDPYLTFSYGSDVGYIYTDLTYPGDLISKAGDTICSILDQIKNILGNYEYFYDLYGNFVFQQIKNYLNKSYSNTIIQTINNNDYQVDYTSGKSVYTFEDTTIISSITNSPQFQQIKNDFIVWGKRKTLSGKEVPIRYHLVIDEKPLLTDTIQQQINIFTSQNASTSYKIAGEGEIIGTQGWMVTDYINVLGYNSVIMQVYRGQEPWMTVDYRINLYDANKTFIRPSNIQQIRSDEYLIQEFDITGATYIRFSCPIYFGSDPNASLSGMATITTTGTKVYHNVKQIADEYGNIKYIIEEGGSDVTVSDFRTDLLLSGIAAQQLATDSNYYYTQLQNEWGKIYDVMNNTFRIDSIENPENLDFFLDFIDTQSDIGEYSVKNIGRRTVAIVDDTINCIFAPTIPDLVIIETGQSDTEEKRTYCQSRGQSYVQVDEAIYNALMPSGGMKSAYDQIKKQLYQYTTFNKQVSLTTIPIYYLQPNTRITIRDTATGIYGDFMIKSISLPIDINGTMNISCTEALKRL